MARSNLLTTTVAAPWVLSATTLSCSNSIAAQHRFRTIRRALWLNTRAIKLLPKASKLSCPTWPPVRASFTFQI
ncbi:MAG: hypothetical protein C0467_31660 [Planctomycetaceae bacterium]|nr:hypothetical protein [Planctomycetaceae bacterium]